MSESNQSVHEEVKALLAHKSAEQRAQLAGTVANRLNASGISMRDRRAAEELARQLAEDTIELVRQELSRAVRHSKSLPRDVAMRIAHDLDSIACPFLEVTEVFSEADWQQLVLTVSRSARVAIARRPDLTEGLVGTLLEVGDAVVAETLVANTQAPLGDPACRLIMDRFADSPWVLESLADRPSLPPEIALHLIRKVSGAARRKLAERYELPEATDATVADAADRAILRLVRETRESDLLDFAVNLRRTGELGPTLLILALREGLLEFFEAGMAVCSGLPLQNVHMLTRNGGSDGFDRLCDKAQIPDPQRAALREALKAVLAARDKSDPKSH